MEMMDMAADDTREELRRKLRSNFDGRIVRKDLTKKIKEGANVPVYVLEFLLGQYCSSDDETIIEQGVQNVKRILADNFVRPDEAQKILSQLRKNGSHTIIDMVTVHLDIKKDCFFAEFSNLGLTNVPITDDYPEKYDRLLCGGIWCSWNMRWKAIIRSDWRILMEIRFALNRKSRRISLPSASISLLQSRCPISTLKKFERDARHSHRKSGWMLCCVPADMSRNS